MRTDTHVTEFNMSDGTPGGRGGKIYTPGRLVQINNQDHSRSDTSCNEKYDRTATTAM